MQIGNSGPQATAKVKDGMLELTVAGGQNSGIYFGEDNWTDYRMEVKARKLVGPYFHLVRTGPGTRSRFLFLGNQL